jgi:hypothetical protein
LKFELATFSFGLKALMAALGTAVYLHWGGMLTPVRLTLPGLVPVLCLCLVWFTLDHLGWDLGEWLARGRAAGQRGDDIVGFVARLGENRQPQGFADAID